VNGAAGGGAQLFRTYWSEVGRERAAAALGMTSAMALGLQIGFSFLDYFAYPDSFSLFFAMRMSVNLILVAILLRARFSHPSASMLTLALSVGLEILAMTYATRATTSDYYAGLIILFVGMPVLMPMSARQAALVCALLTGGYGLAPLFESGATPWRSFVVHLVFLTSGGIESVLSCAFLGRVRLHEFAQRREIERARDELRELDRAKSRFTANVHHELRTPLTLTLAPLESMLGGEFGELTELQREYLKTMHVNALRLLKLINNLLDLARIESRQLELRRRPLEVGRLVEDLVAGARPLAERKRIALTCEGTGELPLLHADPDALEKVFTNLIGNSLKFTEPGGRITVRGEARAGGIHFEVADTGLGIPSDQLERIFDRFAQVDTSATRRHEGTGIGLSLCKELVELHGGRIWAESEGPGRGSRLCLVLPLGRADAEAEEAVVAADDGRTLSARQSFDALGAELGVAGEASAEYRGAELVRSVERFEAGAEAVDPARVESEAPPDAPEVVVAEDNADMRRLLAFLLRGEFRVRLASNGCEALEAVRAREPELVLTDIMMPEMSGVELCRALKEDPRTSAIPVMLVTSKAERATKVEGLELGADDYVTKPFHPRELLARARSLVRLRVLQRELAARNRALERANLELEGTLRELREAQAQLVHREKMASIGQLVAGIAHEINNPVNFIQGNLFYLEEYVRALAGLLRRYEALAEQAGLGERARAVREASEVDRMLADLDAVLAGCREGVERTTSLVRDLRTFSRLDQPDRVWLDVRAALESSLNLLRGRLTGIRVERDYGEIPAVESHAGQLAQVFMNLLANAADALGSQGCIAVRTRALGAERVAIEIEDDGPGIAPEHLERIFDPFFTTKEVGKGTGLGLSISYGIVARHGGTIAVESRPGRGTRFRVELPVRMAAAGGEA
jgi:signal transduction histidine kinase